jgi:hypothetical protein
VGTSGDNANTCADPAQACATLAGALTKAANENTRLERTYAGETLSIFHTINVAAGIYNVTSLHEGYPFANIRINVTVIGEGQGITVFDSGNLYGGIFIDGNAQVALRHFTVRNVNGSAPDSCINIRGSAVVTVERVTLRLCLKTGVSHTSSGLLTLRDVTISRSRDDGGGNGSAVTSSGEVHVEGGRFFRNEGSGIAINVLTMNGGLIDLNSRDGLRIGSTATLDGVEIINNGQDLSFRSGIFLGEGVDVTARNMTLNQNQHGVWLYGEGASLNLIDSSVSGNPRTGIVVSEGELRLTRTVVADNASFYAGTSLGGGLEIGEGGRAILRESQVSGNDNGGINNYGELFLIESALVENNGGMPALFNGAGAVTVIERSLIANNTLLGRIVVGDFAVDNRGEMNIVNATISGNQGHGLSSSGALNLAYTTIAFNENYGLVSSESGTEVPWLAGNIIAGNGTDCYVPGPSGPGPATLDGANIDSDGSCDFPMSVPVAGLMLGPLADNGGPTLTHALLSGSPAMDAATSSSCPSTDQRLETRPFGLRCDLGAYEASGSTLSLETTLEFTTVTPTSEFLTPIFVFTQNALCRSGPSTSYPAINSYNDKDQIEIMARSADNTWFRLAMQAGGHCWVSLVTGEPKGPWQALPVFGAPATNTPEPGGVTDTPMPTVTATCYYDQNQNYICP